MLPTKQKVFRRFWYPVLRESHLDGAPVPFTLLGERIVLWRDRSGKPVCVKDRCCHRTSQLSRGFVEEGNLVCGYHGWTYDGTGRCVRIPQQPPDAKIAEEIRVDAYRCELRYGHVWVALDDPLSGIPDIPEAREGCRRVDQFYEEWKIGAFRLMENSFDQAHVHFVHRRTFGNKDNPTPTKSEIVDFDYGFNYSTELAVKNRDETSHKYLGGEQGVDTVRRNSSTWWMPFIRRLGLTYPHGLRHTIITAATPMMDDRTMVVQFCFRNDTEEQTSAADVIAFDRKVTLEDKEILEATEYDVPLDNTDPREFHMITDRPGLQMRRRLLDLITEHGEVEASLAAPPGESRPQG